MNVLDYSKADISRAKTADYYPGQSASGSFYAAKLNPSQRLDPNLSQTQFYRGDASQQNFRVQGHPAQSYEQYAYGLGNSQPVFGRGVESQHVRFQVQQPQQYQSFNGPYPNQQMNLQYSNQYPTYINDHARYLATEPRYQRQFLSFRPMMASQINQVPRSKFRIDERSEPYHEYDFKVFCPACHQQYYNSQVEEHIQRHYLYNTDQFKLSNLMEATNVPLQQVQQPLSVQSRFYYPLVQPQQFECKELDEVNYMNKYKLEHEQLNKRETNIKVKSQSTQFAKPPLQIRSQNTDIYNCFDNIFNSRNEFSVNDITKSNAIIAKKRQLDDWEKLRSQKEDFTIRKN